MYPRMQDPEDLKHGGLDIGLAPVRARQEMERHSREAVQVWSGS